ncbi:uncharacterized protein LTR77_002154 [Saxophila tyrrhenica]|uniref:Uncharacterized protein n=1 Tax=Saxophila tyrrhenica TaxID=1690608 RepID=A0AAV9PL82_9PEZI|nr:hypothetical protein LTR77_002154 [Saxophila tyrrhenica]
MSYDYRRTTTRSTNSGNRPGRRGYLPPPPSSRGNASGHSVFGYWVPLVVTGTIAIGGLAAWIWSERSDSEDDDYPHEKPPRPQTGVGASYPTQGSQPYPGPPPPGQQGGYAAGPAPPPPPGGEASSYYNQTTTTTSESRDVNVQQDAGWYGRVAGAMKRTPSPQQFFDSTSKQVAAGMAAAGAALGSIMEGSDEEFDERGNRRRSRSSRRDKRTDEGFSDHERWSEEADERQRVSSSAVEAESERRADTARSLRDEKGKRSAKKTVAIVVSADTNADIGYNNDSSAEFTTEHASILSHLPSTHDPSTTDLFVLIYSPGLTTLPPLSYRPGPQSTMGSSYSQISTPAVTPGSELQSMSPRPAAADGPSSQFNALYSQSLALVSSPTQILPFTTPDGFVHILRHLAPQLVYVSDALAGEEGDAVAQLKGWVGHTVLVAGDEGFGGLVDTDTDTDEEGRRRKGGKERWWEDASFVGLGKDVEVVDAARVGEDWGRRVGGRQ